jgi:hypothetical protein
MLASRFSSLFAVLALVLESCHAAPPTAGDKKCQETGTSLTSRGQEGKELFRRNPSQGTHVSGKEKITLYHGTPPVADVEAALDAGISTLRKQKGDFSSTGGFYLTDSLFAAGQWGCHGKAGTHTTVHIYEYTWDGSSLEVKDYSDWTEEKDYINFCFYNYCSMLHDSEGLSKKQADAKKAELKKIGTEFDMFNGPMDPIAGIASDFWQYAVVKAPALSSLVKVTAYKSLSCDKFPKDTDIGEKGRGPSSAFSSADKKSFGIDGGSEEDCSS